MVFEGLSFHTFCLREQGQSQAQEVTSLDSWYFSEGKPTTLGSAGHGGITVTKLGPTACCALCVHACVLCFQRTLLAGGGHSPCREPPIIAVGRRPKTTQASPMEIGWLAGKLGYLTPAVVGHFLMALPGPGRVQHNSSLRLISRCGFLALIWA